MINHYKIKIKMEKLNFAIIVILLLFILILFFIDVCGGDRVGDCQLSGCVYNHDGTPVPNGVIVNVEWNGRNYTTTTKSCSCCCGSNGNYYSIQSWQMGWVCYDGLFTNASAEYNGYYGENSKYVDDDYPTGLDIYLTESVGCTEVSYTINFSEGAGQLDQWWIGISIPLCINETDISEILSGIDGQYDSVERLVPGINKDYEQFLPALPFPPISTFTTMDDGIEYQIHFTTRNPNNITFNGICCPGNKTVTLSPGWNTFGWASLETRNITDVLSPIAGQYDSVERLVPGINKDYEQFLPALPFQPISTFTTFEPGRGYQIHIPGNQNVTFTYSY